jgi:hypothetical protein
MDRHREEVRRDSDGELLGFVEPRGGGGWAALAVFGGTIGVRDDRGAAIGLVEAEGLDSLAQRWFHRSAARPDWRVVVIQEAWPGRAVGVIGLYALPGAPPFAITADDLAAGDEMTLEPPDDADLGDFFAPRD